MAAVNMRMTYNGGAAAYGAALHSKLSGVVKKIARDVHAQAVVEIIQGEKSGRVYTRGGVTHQASAPDESPASDTGNLIDSINVTDETELTSTINAPAEYAVYLEVGTARMSPRPFMSPALASVEPAFIAACEKAIATS